MKNQRYSSNTKRQIKVIRLNPRQKERSYLTSTNWGHLYCNVKSALFSMKLNHRDEQNTRHERYVFSLFPHESRIWKLAERKRNKGIIFPDKPGLKNVENDLSLENRTPALIKLAPYPIWLIIFLFECWNGVKVANFTTSWRHHLTLTCQMLIFSEIFYFWEIEYF